MASSQVCDERRVAPSGSKMEIGFVATCLLQTGASLVRKWPVAPVSLMAVSIWRVGGFVRWMRGVGSSSSSLNPESIANLFVCLGVFGLVGVTTLVEEHVTRLFSLSSTNGGAPPRQARCGSGLMGMIVLCAALCET